ncbi:hypothetical protein JOM56_007915 [Amanita muscaria]
MSGDQTDSVWDMVSSYLSPTSHTIRCKAVIVPANSDAVMPHKHSGGGRQGLVQMKERVGIDEGTGRLDENKRGPNDILNASYSLKAAEECQWWTIYQVGQRVADKFTVNECIFICGDACHTHSPRLLMASISLIS